MPAALSCLEGVPDYTLSLLAGLVARALFDLHLPVLLLPRYTLHFMFACVVVSLVLAGELLVAVSFLTPSVLCSVDISLFLAGGLWCCFLFAHTLCAALCCFHGRSSIKL